MRLVAKTSAQMTQMNVRMRPSTREKIEREAKRVGKRPTTYVRWYLEWSFNDEEQVPLPPRLADQSPAKRSPRQTVAV